MAPRNHDRQSPYALRRKIRAHDNQFPDLQALARTRCYIQELRNPRFEVGTFNYCGWGSQPQKRG